MVDHTALVVIGSVVIALGLGLALASGPLARSHAAYLRSGRQRPRPVKLLPFWDRPEHERYLRASLLLSGLFVALIGGMWVAGIGVN
jgi:hypothetical protein